MPLPETPEALPHAFAAAWNARDADALADLFDADAEFVNVVGLWWHDREAIRRAHAYGLEVLFPDSSLRVTRTTVKPLAPGVALVHARMRLTGQTGIGDVEAPGARSTVFSFVVREVLPSGPEDASLARGFGWSVVSAHNTDIVPGAETHVRDASGQLRAADYRSGRVSE